MHNANNSGTTGRVRRTLGFSGFLVVQTFNCQDELLCSSKEIEKWFNAGFNGASRG